MIPHDAMPAAALTRPQHVPLPPQSDPWWNWKGRRETVLAAMEQSRQAIATIKRLEAEHARELAEREEALALARLSPRYDALGRFLADDSTPGRPMIDGEF